MKALITSALLILGAMSGCSKDAGNAPQQSCDNEHVLASYQNREAVVTQTQLDTYCLIVDETALSSGRYLVDNYLVPVHPLPAQYQVEGLRVLLTGRKKSCYGLTTLPELRNMFGYKLEVDNLQAKQ